jgi:hypothetical protein
MSTQPTTRELLDEAIRRGYRTERTLRGARCYFGHKVATARTLRGALELALATPAETVCGPLGIRVLRTN